MCCARIWRAGERQPQRVPARYLWVFAQSGHVELLCEKCYASYKANALEDPALDARSVVRLPPTLVVVPWRPKAQGEGS